MRRIVVLSVVLVASLAALVPEAHAKLCVRIEAPTTARVGAAVTIRVTTLLPTWDGRRLVGLEPVRAYTDGFALRLTLTAPDAGYRELRLRRTKDPAVWVARTKLRQHGVWSLAVSGWEYAPRACAPAARILVRA